MVTLGDNIVFRKCRRRVHISRAVLNELKGEFEVEPGHGMSRDEYLRENGIETFFISVTEVRS